MSDSHGKTGTVSDIVDNNLGKAQMFIHLGDGKMKPTLFWRNIRISICAGSQATAITAADFRFQQ